MRGSARCEAYCASHWYKASIRKDTDDNLRQWWASVEHGAISGQPADLDEGVQRTLALVHHHELYHRLDEARAALADLPRKLPSPWREVRSLLACRITTRGQDSSAQAKALRLLQRLTEDVGETYHSLAARCCHLMGVLRLRLNQFELAEKCLMQALMQIEDSPSKIWILDGFAQVYIGTGAWIEARQTLDAIIQKKGALGDLLGLAISAGHLALMELRLGNPDRAQQVALEARRQGDCRLTSLSKLRLQTLAVEAIVDLQRRAQLPAASRELIQLLKQTGPATHYLKGFATLAIARACQQLNAPAQVNRWMRRARSFCQSPDQRLMYFYWQSKLSPRVTARATWKRQVQAVTRQCTSVSDGEVFINLHLAGQDQEAGRLSKMQAHLDHAFALATQGNNRLLMEVVDRQYAECDPAGFARKMVERFSGGRADEVTRTVKTEATIVFVDLANFTARSTELSPDDVMATVRSLFELSTPLLARGRVRPITYLGDGLLACAQGAGHRARALKFAIELSGRASRATHVRSELGQAWGLDIRAGVATGPVVLGPLGNLLKLDFAAIGLTTNLASRLQGQANPGEVLCDARRAVPGYEGSAHEYLSLKGFAEPIPAVRIAADRLA